MPSATLTSHQQERIEMSRHNLHNTEWTHAVNVFVGRKLFHRASQNSNLSVTARSCNRRQLLDSVIQFRLSWGQLGSILVLTSLLVSGLKNIFSPKTKWCFEGQITFPSSSYLAFSPSIHLVFAFWPFWDLCLKDFFSQGRPRSTQDDRDKGWHSKRLRSCNIISCLHCGNMGLNAQDPSPVSLLWQAKVCTVANSSHHQVSQVLKDALDVVIPYRDCGKFVDKFRTHR